MLRSLAGSGDKVSPLQSGPINFGHSAASAPGSPAKPASSSIARATLVLRVIMIADPPVGAAWMAGTRAAYTSGSRIVYIEESRLGRWFTDRAWQKKADGFAKIPGCLERRFSEA